MTTKFHGLSVVLLTEFRYAYFYLTFDIIFFVLLQYLQETLGDFVQSVYESEEECEVK